MNEMQLLDRFGSEVEPDPAALRRARRRFLRHALASQPRRRLRRRRVLMGTAAAVVTTAVLVAGTIMPGGGGAESAAGRVLDRAARSADATVVGHSQWLQVRSDTTRWGVGAPEHTVQESWVPGDPNRDTRFRDFEGLVYRRPLDLPAIATRPDVDVNEVFDWLMRDNGDLRGADAAFERAGETLADDVIPMAFKARLFDAIKQIDGTRVISGSTDFGDREAILLGRPDGVFETQLAFDSSTGEFIGYQGVIGDDQRLDYRTILTVSVVDSLPARAKSCLALGNEVDGWNPPPTCEIR